LLSDKSGPYTFSVGNTQGLGEYKSGGLFMQVKMPKLLQFVSYFSRGTVWHS